MAMTDYPPTSSMIIIRQGEENFNSSPDFIPFQGKVWKQVGFGVVKEQSIRELCRCSFSDEWPV